MALNKINSAVSELITETKVAAINEFITFLEDKIDIDSELKAIFDGYILQVQSDVSGSNLLVRNVKRQRVASKYNLYIKTKMAELKATGNFKGKELMAAAVAAWKVDKSNGVV